MCLVFYRKKPLWTFWPTQQKEKINKQILPKNEPDKIALYSGQLEARLENCENFMCRMQLK